MVYVGVDLHRKRSHVVALDPTAEVVLPKRIGNAPVEFWRLFGELEPGPIEVAFEATYGWSWFADLLAGAGIPATWLTRWPPRRPRPPGSRTTPSTPRPWPTCCARTCWLRPGSPHRRPGRPADRSAPGPGWSGCAHASNPSSMRCWADLGIIPELTTLFGPAGRRWLAELQLPTGARGRLDAGLRLIDAITVEVGRADADLRTAFAGDDRVRRLLPIPGIGLVTAATVVAEVWDIQRFPSPERLCSWAGLTPGERTSDAHTRRGHITKQGSRWLRWMLVEAATTAVRDPSRAASPARSPSAAVPRSPGWRWPDGCSPCATTPCATMVAAVPTQPPTIVGGLVRARSVCVMALLCNGRRLD